MQVKMANLFSSKLLQRCSYGAHKSMLFSEVAD